MKHTHTKRRTPMAPMFRWLLVDGQGLWRVANMTFENERIALEVRDRCFRPKDGVVPVRVRIAPARKATR